MPASSVSLLPSTPAVHCTKVRGAQTLSPTRRVTLCKGRAINNCILYWKRQCAWHLSKHIISVVDFISLSPSHLRMSIRLGPQEDYNICIFSYGYLLGWFLWQKLGSPTVPICNTGGSENLEVASPWSSMPSTAQAQCWKSRCSRQSLMWTTHRRPKNLEFDVSGGKQQQP